MRLIAHGYLVNRKYRLNANDLSKRRTFAEPEIKPSRDSIWNDPPALFASRGFLCESTIDLSVQTCVLQRSRLADPVTFCE